MFFNLIKKDKNTKARLGLIKTKHGDIETPFFMPVGTNGAVKTLSFEDLHQMNSPIMLSNTYHLYLRPGLEVLKKFGGLHNFSGWKKPILTDSGGYQIFSLAKLRKLTDEGADFQSHIDGTSHFLTPEKIIDVQQIIGGDMIMPLDECSPYPCGYKEAAKAVDRTTNWLMRSKKQFLKNKMDKDQFLFGIIQGATYKDLREKSAQEILKIGLDGYAVGGVSVGEPVDEMFKALHYVMPLLPDDKPHYFMGIGLPDQMVRAVGLGIDMFDTVLPSRFGRHSTVLTRKGRFIIRNSEFADDNRPIDDQCECIVCKNYSRAYIRHLTHQGEITGLKFVAYHNVYFYIDLMKKIRQAIKEDRYDKFQKEFLKEYGSELLNEV